MSTSRRIGFIGLGNMGMPMAANLVRGGHDVMGYDLAPERARLFSQSHTARAAESLAALAAHAEILVTMLPSGREVREVLLTAQDGTLAAGLQRGTIVIDMSSADPVGTRALGAELAARGLTLVDAPVSGGVTRAADGTLAIMIGGEASAVAAVTPVLAAMGRNLFEVGGPGCGHAMKALNNYLAGAANAAACEAVTIGQRFGLDPAVMADVINASTGRSFVSEQLIKQHVLSGAFGTGFALGLLAKDVGIAADLAQAIEIDAPLLRLVRTRWDAARDVLGGAADHTCAWQHWQRT
ncbi:MAG: NAD(P)-dependent oxidoreductase [Hyphomicrobiales bacterium]|nr:NAD(P)-dependent oxidoreductase [Hyphomicrobiales bacterium]